MSGNDQAECLQAVLIVESFDNRLHPIWSQSNTAFLPLIDRPLIEYALSYLQRLRVDQCIVYSRSHLDKISDYISNTGWLSYCRPRGCETSSESPGSPGIVGAMSVVLQTVEDHWCLGDVMRDLDAKALIQSDFVLMCCDCVSNIDVVPLLKSHSAMRKGVDRGLAMTVILRDEQDDTSGSSSSQSVWMMDSGSRQLLLLQRRSCQTPSSVHLPLELLEQHDTVQVCHGLRDASLWLCSPCVPQLFTDNFDFQHMEHFIRGVLMSEEITGNTIQCALPREGYLANIDSISALVNVIGDILHRRLYPVGVGLPVSLWPQVRCLANNVYRHCSAVVGSGSKLGRDVFLGGGVSVGAGSSLSCSVIGEGSRVGAGCVLAGVVLGRGCSVADGVRVHRCLLGDRVTLGQSVSVGRFCVFGSDVRVARGTVLPAWSYLVPDQQLGYRLCNSDRGRSLSAGSDSDDLEEEAGQQATPLRWGEAPCVANCYSDSECFESSEESEFESGSESGLAQHIGGLSMGADDSDMFRAEVCDSILRGYTDKVSAANLILEINASKFAYNIPGQDVIEVVVRAVLSLPESVAGAELSSAEDYWRHLHPCLLYCLPLLLNYVKEERSMALALSAVEVFCCCHKAACACVARLLQLCYDRDLLSEDAIVSWYRAMSSAADHTAAQGVRSKASALVEWLENAEEESD